MSPNAPDQDDLIRAKTPVIFAQLGVLSLSITLATFSVTALVLPEKIEAIGPVLLSAGGAVASGLVGGGLAGYQSERKRQTDFSVRQQGERLEVDAPGDDR